jgi:adenosylmethionine-8-amino-7-oxononanoate aminotransferase
MEIGRRALEKGLLTRFDPHWLALGPPLIVDAQQIDEMVSVVDEAISEILRERGASSP